MRWSRWLWALAFVASSGPLQGDAPPIAPAFVAERLVAIGHITGNPPPPGAGVGVGGCTGTLIAPTIFLTAAHCVANRVNNPEDLYITFGWSRNGPPLWRGRAARVILYPEYPAPGYGLQTLHLDLALVLFPRPVPETLVPPIPLSAGQRADSYASYGYQAQADTLLRGDDGCQAVTLTEAGLWGFDCDVVGGFSGGPLIAESPDGPVVAAVAVANARGVETGVRSFAAVPEPRLFPEGAFP